MLRAVLLVLILGAPLTLAGCQSSGSGSDRLDTDSNVPKCRKKAKRLEDRALQNVRAANKRLEYDKRREHYDLALDQLREARLLYEKELKKDPGSEEKQANLQAEIERLTERIERVHRDRPLE